MSDVDPEEAIRSDRSEILEKTVLKAAVRTAHMTRERWADLSIDPTVLKQRAGVSRYPRFENELVRLCAESKGVELEYEPHSDSSHKYPVLPVPRSRLGLKIHPFFQREGPHGLRDGPCREEFRDKIISGAFQLDLWDDYDGSKVPPGTTGVTGFIAIEFDYSMETLIDGCALAFAKPSEKDWTLRIDLMSEYSSFVDDLVRSVTDSHGRSGPDQQPPRPTVKEDQGEGTNDGSHT
jgi:hypothetical protein